MTRSVDDALLAQLNNERDVHVLEALIGALGRIGELARYRS